MRRLLILLALWLTLGQARALALSQFPIIDLSRVQDNEGFFLGGQVAFWVNTRTPMDPAVMVTGQHDGNFMPSAKDIPGPSHLKGEIWLRFVIHNPEPRPRALVLESGYALTDFISFYQKDPNGQLLADHRGDRSVSRPDPYAFRRPAFALTAWPGENIYYLRSASQGPNILSLHLWHEAGFRGHRFLDTAFLSALFGFLLALFIYNSFLAFSLRSRTYSYYSAFLLSMILLQMSMQNVWPYLVKPEWAVWLDNEGYVTIGTFTSCLSVLVTIAFLSMKKILPNFLRFFQCLLIFTLMPLMAGLVLDFDQQARFMSASVGVGSFSLIVACVAAILRGYQPAAYYLLASVTFLGANIFLTLNLLGIYHVPHVIQYGNFVSVVIQGLLMSLAIGDRVQFIRAQADGVIRRLNQELQNHLTHVEALVAERTETIRTILDNVASGFVIVNREGNIVKGFSRSCHQLLGQNLVEGQPFVNLLQLNPVARKTWTLAWEQIFSDLMPTEVSLAQLPSQIRLGPRALRLECKALRDEEGRIKTLLLTILDVTELKRKTRESRRHRLLIKILQDLEAFRQFINHSHDFIARLKVSTDPREQAFLLHTLKGNSTVFGLTQVARRLHQLEECHALNATDIQSIEHLFQHFLDAHASILKTPWGSTPQLEARVTAAQLQELEVLVERRNDSGLQEDVAGWIQNVVAKPVRTFVQPIIENCQLLAQRLNRPVRIEVRGHEVRVRSQQEEKALEFLVHILRNAIVHGMDEDRRARGKDPVGSILLEFSESPQGLMITCRDDGRGFDRQHWESKARAAGGPSGAALSRLNWLELVELVSRGGHSTQDMITMEAGRGVGLEGIIQAVRELGGRIHLETDPGQGTSLQIEIERHVANQAA
ncbi:7TM diverse intracellular signaling domain-containing protein [Oligoflexus tunisiensis]|uniref:7TM diverse intracellular signaling domain-containing protein n=1 Tax=Oligoflexus tunisiensis TaxID=708132 RepID=UPI00159F034F|nr:7TM diverse intracellular signaling domain-containing protein [Oligoflexus tunisiensis]